MSFDRLNHAESKLSLLEPKAELANELEREIASLKNEIKHVKTKNSILEDHNEIQSRIIRSRPVSPVVIHHYSRPCSPVVVHCSRPASPVVIHHYSRACSPVAVHCSRPVSPCAVARFLIRIFAYNLIEIYKSWNQEQVDFIWVYFFIKDPLRCRHTTALKWSDKTLSWLDSMICMLETDWTLWTYWKAIVTTTKTTSESFSLWFKYVSFFKLFKKSTLNTLFRVIFLNDNE